MLVTHPEAAKTNGTGIGLSERTAMRPAPAKTPEPECPARARPWTVLRDRHADPAATYDVAEDPGFLLPILVFVWLVEDLLLPQPRSTEYSSVSQPRVSHRVPLPLLMLAHLLRRPHHRLMQLVRGHAV